MAEKNKRILTLSLVLVSSQTHKEKNLKKPDSFFYARCMAPFEEK